MKSSAAFTLLFGSSGTLLRLMMILLKTAGMCDYFYEVKRDVILCTHARMYHITVFFPLPRMRITEGSGNQTSKQLALIA